MSTQFFSKPVLNKVKILESKLASNPDALTDDEISFLEKIDEQLNKAEAPKIRKTASPISLIERFQMGLLDPKLSVPFVKQALRSEFPENKFPDLDVRIVDNSLLFSPNGRDYKPIGGDILGGISEFGGRALPVAAAVGGGLTGGLVGSALGTGGVQLLREATEAATGVREQPLLERGADILGQTAVDLAGGAVIGQGLRGAKFVSQALKGAGQETLAETIEGIPGKLAREQRSPLAQFLEKIAANAPKATKGRGLIREELALRKLEELTKGIDPNDSGRIVQNALAKRISDIDSEADVFFKEASEISEDSLKKGNFQFVDFEKTFNEFKNILNRRGAGIGDINAGQIISNLENSLQSFKKDPSIAKAYIKQFGKEAIDTLNLKQVPLSDLLETRSAIRSTIETLEKKGQSGSKALLTQLKNSIDATLGVEIPEQAKTFGFTKQSIPGSAQFFKANKILREGFQQIPQELRDKIVSKSIGGISEIVSPEAASKALDGLDVGQLTKINKVVSKIGPEEVPNLKKAVQARIIEKSKTGAGPAGRPIGEISEEVIEQASPKTPRELQGFQKSGIVPKPGLIEKILKTSEEAGEFQSSIKPETALKFLTKGSPGFKQAPRFEALLGKEEADDLLKSFKDVAEGSSTAGIPSSSKGLFGSTELLRKIPFGVGNFLGALGSTGQELSGPASTVVRGLESVAPPFAPSRAVIDQFSSFRQTRKKPNRETEESLNKILGF